MVRGACCDRLLLCSCYVCPPVQAMYSLDPEAYAGAYGLLREVASLLDMPAVPSYETRASGFQG
jgi:hypothetical protein